MQVSCLSAQPARQVGTFNTHAARRQVLARQTQRDATTYASATSAPPQARKQPTLDGPSTPADQKHMLEETFRLEGASSPKLPPLASGASRRAAVISNSAAATRVPVARRVSAAPSIAPPSAPEQLLTWLVEVERKLEADIVSLSAAVLFMVALITYERGVQDLLDTAFGDSPLGSVACIITGLLLVFGVKASGVRWTAFWDMSNGASRRRG